MENSLNIQKNYIQTKLRGTHMYIPTFIVKLSFGANPSSPRELQIVYKYKVLSFTITWV